MSHLFVSICGFNMLELQLTFNMVLKAFSTRLKAFHIINAPPFAGVFVELIKSILSSKLVARDVSSGCGVSRHSKCRIEANTTSSAQREPGLITKDNPVPVFSSPVSSLTTPLQTEATVHVHGKDLTELHKQVPKESLPTEMGGCGGSIIDNWNLWLKKLETYQDWFLQHENVKSDEKKRLEGNDISSDLFGFEGSFRKLDVD
ncbi:hypothetical protein ANN_26721 [Periplaneta americana]|uniref:CRAL-TRIO domain-containing protein n=1 Tax=Periplaneta americana TaxID=6978 RepID=A0ABQ8RZ35_PERAM|nr:hypothetical protein ANN_26721 [Periplaneta americana]